MAIEDVHKGMFVQVNRESALSYGLPVPWRTDHAPMFVKDCLIKKLYSRSIDVQGFTVGYVPKYTGYLWPIEDQHLHVIDQELTVDVMFILWLIEPLDPDAWTGAWLVQPEHMDELPFPEI